MKIFIWISLTSPVLDNKQIHRSWPKICMSDFFSKIRLYICNSSCKMSQTNPIFSKVQDCRHQHGETRSIVLVLFYRSSRRGANVEQQKFITDLHTLQLLEFPLKKKKGNNTDISKSLLCTYMLLLMFVILHIATTFILWKNLKGKDF